MRFPFYKNSLEDATSLAKVFKEHNPDVVVNLAGQAELDTQ